MGKLSQKIRGVGGRLSDVSAEEASRRVGRDVTPTSPAGGAMIGTGPDQSKMLGTPQQTRNAIRTAMEGSSPQEGTLQARMRSTQSLSPDLQEDAMSKAEQFSQLQGMEGRVAQLAEQKIQETLSSAVEQGGVETDVAGNQELQVALEALLVEPTPTNALKVNQLMGREKNPMSVDELFQYFKLGVGSGEPGSSKLTEEEVAGLLGLEVGGEETGYGTLGTLLDEDLTGQQLSVSEILDKINSKVQEEYSKVAELQDQLADPSLGPAERVELMKELRQAGVSGVRVAEDTIENVWEKIEGSETIEFLGEELEMSDIFDNDFTTGLAKKFTDNPDSEWSQKLKEKYPDLTSFLQQNETVIREQLRDVDEALTNFAEIVETNLSNKPGMVSDDLMDKLMPGWSDPTSEILQPPAVVDLIHNLPEVDSASLVSNLDYLAREIPSYLDEVRSMSPSQISDLGLTGDTVKFSRVKEYVETAKKLQSGLPYENVVGYPDRESFDRDRREVQAAKNSGLFDSVDDSLFDPQKMNLQSTYLTPEGNLKSIVEIAKNPPNVGQKRFNTQSSIQEFNSDPTYAAVKSAFLDNDRIDQNELNNITNNASVDTLGDLYKHPRLSNQITGMDTKTYRDVILSSARNKMSDDISGVYQSAGHGSREQMIDTAAKGISGKELTANADSDMSHVIATLTDKIGMETNPVKKEVYIRERDTVVKDRAQFRREVTEYRNKKPTYNTTTSRASSGKRQKSGTDNLLSKLLKGIF